MKDYPSYQPGDVVWVPCRDPDCTDYYPAVVTRVLDAGGAFNCDVRHWPESAQLLHVRYKDGHGDGETGATTHGRFLRVFNFQVQHDNPAGQAELALPGPVVDIGDSRL